MSSPLPPASDAGDGVVVNDRLTIPRAELTFRATKSGGPGGQHVNTSSTRVELLWSPATSAVLPDELRARLLEKLASRLDGEGMVRIVASENRSQLRNRQAAAERLGALVRAALVVRKKRRATKPSRAAKEARLGEKKIRSERKARRRRPTDE